VLIISLISILYYFLVIKRTRKIRANELDENVEYGAMEDNKDKNDNIIND
jgi:hypothetical protein